MDDADADDDDEGEEEENHYFPLLFVFHASQC